MTSEQFVYWMQGFCELHGEPPTKEQWEMVKDHLQTVFHKVTPERRDRLDVTDWLNSKPYCTGVVDPKLSSKTIC